MIIDKNAIIGISIIYEVLIPSAYNYWGSIFQSQIIISCYYFLLLPFSIVTCESNVNMSCVVTYR